MRGRVQTWFQTLGLPAWIVPDYTFMLLFGIAAAAFLTLLLWRRAGHADRTAADLIFWGIPGLFIGARLVSWLQFGFPSNWQEVWTRSGFALYGGLAGLLVAWSVYHLVRPYPILEFLDCISPGLAAGLFLGRIGCFMAGCDGGTPSALRWAVRFAPGTSSYDAQLSEGLIRPEAALSISAHPTQLYEAVFGLIAFFLLMALSQKRTTQGEVFFTGMFWYGLYRLVSEPLRAASGGWHPASWLTFAQMLSLILIAAAVTGTAYVSVKARRPRPVPSGAPPTLLP